MAERFSEWISCSAHFVIILLPLAEGWRRAMAASDRHCQRSRTEYPNCPVPHIISSESDSMPLLVGSAPPSAAQMGQIEEGGGHAPRAPTSWPRERPPKACPMKDGAGNLLLSSPDIGGLDSDGYSTVSEAQNTHHHRRRQWGEKHLAPICLDMPIFKSTDPNADVTYTLWRFDVQGWLDQYQEEGMMPHIYNSLRGYPGRWVCSLE